MGVVVQGGTYNTLIRALNHLGLADVYGESQLPLYVMNVAYPLVDAEFERFCQGKRAILVLEEGQPNFVEQNVADILRRLGSPTTLHGKDLLPLAGEYNTATLLKGLTAFLPQYGKLAPEPPARTMIPLVAAPAATSAELAANVHARPPGFCTGCPERPIFTAMKLVERELGPHHVTADIGCHLFSILPPFNIGATTMGYGLGAASAAALPSSTASATARAYRATALAESSLPGMT